LENLKFLVVEDDDLARQALSLFLSERGVVEGYGTKKETLCSEGDWDIVFLDLDLERDLDGMELVSSFSKKYYTVILSGREEDKIIEECYRKGCQDYLTKPFSAKSIELVLRRYGFSRKERQIRELISSKLKTENKEFIEQLNRVSKGASSSLPFLLTGETGTGKTILAETIHEINGYPKEKFVALNCSALPENLIESELFGFEKGAFSGADQKKKGFLELANGGTLFLDEVGTMSLSMQQKLLKVVEEGVFYPLGSHQSVRTNFRLITATCDDLPELIKKGKFREDFYFRLKGICVTLPPLRERKDDILILEKYFQTKNMRRVVFTEDAKEAMKNYDWPGNVRELESVILELATHSTGVVDSKDLPFFEKLSQIVKKKNLLSGEQVTYLREYGLKSLIEAVEECAIEITLKKNNQRVRRSLADLQISNSSFYRISERMGEKAK